MIDAMHWQSRIVLGRAVGFILVWVSGLAVLWHALPDVPREGWQPTEQEYWCGFLTDGQTVVTVPLRSEDGGWEDGPIKSVHLWDATTGRLRARHSVECDMAAITVPLGLDLLVAEKTVTNPETSARGQRVRLYEAFTGKELASFYYDRELFEPKPPYIVAGNGRTIAILTWRQGQPRLEWYDARSGRLLHVLTDCYEPFCFSPDGQQFAVTRARAIAVFDVAAKQEIGQLRWPAADPQQIFPKNFSADGRFLVDDQGNVWEVATATRRLGVPAVASGDAAFTPDGQFLVVVAQSQSKSWLAYYELATGREREELRIPLHQGENPRTDLWPATPDGRFLLARGAAFSREPTATERWLAHLPGLGFLDRTREVCPFVVVDVQAARTVMAGTDWVVGCSPDGRLLVTEPDRRVYQYWDVPPPKSLPWFLTGALAWTVVCGCLAAWRTRRARRPSRPEVHVIPAADQ